MKETIFFEPDEQPKNFLQGSKEDLYIYLIDHFSMPGNLILDMTETEGIIPYIVGIFTGHTVVFNTVST